jgi:hypothetical protein
MCAICSANLILPDFRIAASKQMFPIYEIHEVLFGCTVLVFVTSVIKM